MIWIFMYYLNYVHLHLNMVIILWLIQGEWKLLELYRCFKRSFSHCRLKRSFQNIWHIYKKEYTWCVLKNNNRKSFSCYYKKYTLSFSKQFLWKAYIYIDEVIVLSFLVTILKRYYWSESFFGYNLLYCKHFS